MRYDLSRLCVVVFLGLLVIPSGISIVAAQDDGVTVYIYRIDKPDPWKGKPFPMNGKWYWAGEIHIQYGGEPPSGTHARAYCMQYDIILYTGRTYEYTKTPAADSDDWKKIGYILSWHDPPEDDAEAAAVQGSIWQILTGYDPSRRGSAFASEADGNDVLRGTDRFVWVTPENYVGPGEEITLTAKVTKPSGHGRPKVRVEFETTAGTIDKEEGFTDSKGEVSVTLTAPSKIGTIVEVTAHTRGVWPELYLCTPETQDLIGVGDTLDLTATTDLYVIAKIHVIPEIPYGTLTAVLTCILAYIVKARKPILTLHT